MRGKGSNATGIIRGKLVQPGAVGAGFKPAPTRLLLAFRYPVDYNNVVVEIRQTEVYARWFRRLRDREARVRIDGRIRRLSLGNPGDVRPVGEGVSEIRIDYGPGYRVYFVRLGWALVVLLAGGDKDSQERDIRRALELARGL